MAPGRDSHARLPGLAGRSVLLLLTVDDARERCGTRRAGVAAGSPWSYGSSPRSARHVRQPLATTAESQRTRRGRAGDVAAGSRDGGRRRRAEKARHGVSDPCGQLARRAARGAGLAVGPVDTGSHPALAFIASAAWCSRVAGLALATRGPQGRPAGVLRTTAADGDAAVVAIVLPTLLAFKLARARAVASRPARAARVGA